MHAKSFFGLGLFTVGTAFVVLACGDASDSKFGDGTDSGDTTGNNTIPEGGSFGNTEGGSGLDGGDPYANDPPPMYCVLDGGGSAPVITGTADCPSDKNKPGCPCSMAGQTAACWTGLRKNRDLGQCKDGMTTCEMHGEIGLTWGDCVGEVLPDMNAKKGKAACLCFSAGQWKLSNTSPCFASYDNGATNYGVSTVDDGSGAKCPDIGTMAPPPKPSQDWSKDTLNVDCQGHFKLCYEIKAGDIANPSAADCSVTGKLCVEADYPMKGVDQPFPNVPAWVATDTACNDKFVTSGGYGEMTVIGEDLLCDKIDDGSGNPEVFNRVKYCPLDCNNPMPKDPSMCVNCQQGGSGSF